ncbi:sulfur carrier protein ThiS [Noviherbaspirillum sp.]|uniref:sulfur carrier protein ThiS n=1 Tax=Noviherbaspirillum sp. TaxID=1926288 RepID=UPI002B49D40C|nr:sulfur carrier protein ThiS [Noviherbaspirillum sp.]HJV81144.1 sulfur carrier protein ThiS [Noviherbaspirillum sp.]
MTGQLRMEIELNGTLHPITENLNVQDLIASLDLTSKSLAVAINREVVPRHMWAQRVLQPSDRVDIVRAIGGG